MKPVFRVVPPRHGIAWIVQSLALLRAQPARLFLIAMLLQLILGLAQLPLVGLLIIISVPALSAGLLQAFQVAAEGRNPSPFLLFQPLLSGSRSGRMLAMGALMFAVGLLTVSLVLSGSEAMLDPELLSRIEQGDVDALVALDPSALQSMALAFLIGIAVSGTLSYMTIPLIWFHDRKLAAALVEGLKALVVNWKPFLLLGFGLAAMLIPVSLAAGALFILAGSAGALSFVVMGLVMILLLAFQLMIFGTQFCAFREIFGIETGQAGSEKPDDGQLVA
jgi:hypothetical protein